MGNVLSGCRQVHRPYKVKRPYEVDSHFGSTIKRRVGTDSLVPRPASTLEELLRTPTPRETPQETRAEGSTATTRKGVCFSWISMEIGRGPGDEPLACKSCSLYVVRGFSCFNLRSLSSCFLVESLIQWQPRGPR